MSARANTRALRAALLGALVLALLISLSSGGTAPASAKAGSGDGGVVLTDLGEFDTPVHVAAAPGRQNRKLLFVVEQGGLVRVLRDGVLLPRPFADLTTKVSTGFERGLLSIEFDPNYAKNRRLYAYMTDLQGNIRVSQLRRSASSRVVTKPRYDREVITIPHPTFANHNGGLAEFGFDGHLYVATGDGGAACDPNENAQNPDSLLGKLLRIDPLPRGGYSIPRTNPFRRAPGADEIYSTGLRNPFRFSFDERTKTIAIGDVGQGAVEEIDYLRLARARGANFGWDALEGSAPPPGCGSDIAPLPSGAVGPIHQYGHAGEGYTGCAVIAGTVVRDPRLPTLRERLLFSDSCNGEIQSLVPKPRAGLDPGPIGVSVGSPSSIVSGRGGRVYISDLTGHVYRLDPASSARRTRSAPASERAGDGRGGFRGVRIARMSNPTYVTGPKGANGLLFVTEQAGVIRMIKGGREVGGKFLDIRDRVESGGERGLLSVAFPRDYGSSGLFYVYYTRSDGDLVIEEYRRAEGDARKALEDSARTVLVIEHSEHPNHNGGQLQFGPDGNLYIGTGDGGAAGDPPENAQNKGSLLGKLLRIDPRQDGDRPYSVPAGNPFAGGQGQAEIYALGLRNPYRFSFDRRSGAIAIGDVGQDRIEEIDYETLASARGANFGWDAFEGRSRFKSSDASPPPADHTRPIFDYDRRGGECTVIGGYVSRDRRIPALQGRLLYADLCTGDIRSLVPSGNRARGDRATGLPSKAGIATFGEDARGGLYYANVGTGDVFAIKPKKGKKGK